MKARGGGNMAAHGWLCRRVAMEFSEKSVSRLTESRNKRHAFGGHAYGIFLFRVVLVNSTKYAFDVFVFLCRLSAILCAHNDWLCNAQHAYAFV